jgi:hypothetical protein
MPLMQPQMIAGAAPQGAGPHGVMMMPMQPMAQMAAQMAAPGSVRPMDANMAPGIALPYPMDPTQYGGRFSPDTREPVGAYPRTPNAFQPNAAPSPTFSDLCSPTYQSSESYNQYVRDIMNADGDEFQFA